MNGYNGKIWQPCPNQAIKHDVKKEKRNINSTYVILLAKMFNQNLVMRKQSDQYRMWEVL